MKASSIVGVYSGPATTGGTSPSTALVGAIIWSTTENRHLYWATSSWQPLVVAGSVVSPENNPATTVTTEVNSAGSLSTYARGDHQHAHGSHPGYMLPGLLHAEADNSNYGFMSPQHFTLLSMATTGSSGAADSGKLVMLDPTGKISAAQSRRTTASGFDSNVSGIEPAGTPVYSTEMSRLGVSNGTQYKVLHWDAPSVAPPAIGASSSLGGGNYSFAFSNHTHAHGGVNTSAGAADAGKLVILGATGLLNANMLPPASGSAAGSMSSSDFTKLQGIAAGATVGPAAPGSAPPAIAAVGATGTAGTYATATHTHAHGGISTGTGAPDAGKLVVTNGAGVVSPSLLPTASGSSAGTMSTADYNKLAGIAAGATVGPSAPGSAPPAIAASGATGTAGTYATATHTHAHGSQTDPTMHAVASGSAHGFMASADYTRLYSAKSSTAGAADAGKLVQLDAVTGKLDYSVFWTATTSADAAAAYFVRLNSSAKVDTTLLSTIATGTATPANDAGKVVVTNASGDVDTSLLPLANSVATAAPGLVPQFNASARIDGDLVVAAQNGGGYGTVQIAVDSSVATPGRAVILDSNSKISSTLFPAGSTVTTVTTSAGASDAGKVTALDVNGKLSETFMPVPITATSAGATDAGDIVRLDANGRLDDSLFLVGSVPHKGLSVQTRPAIGNGVQLVGLGDRPVFTVMPYVGLALADQFALQPAEYGPRVRSWHATAGAATGITWNFTATALGAGGVARTPAMTASSKQAPATRVGYVCAAAAGSSAGLRDNATVMYPGGSPTNYGGGFFMIARVSFPVALTGARIFVGMTGTLPTNSEPSTWNNAMGWEMDTSDANMYFMSRGSVLARQSYAGITRTALASAANIYEFVITSKRGTTQPATGSYRLVDGLWSGGGSGSIGTSTHYPAAATALYPVVWINNGATATQHAVDIHYMYVETEL